MKKAFTMMELVFVIVVIGILLAIIIPRIHTDKINEAGVQILGHIRYTQHLAMVDDKYNALDSNWFLGRWQISFSNANATRSYRIFSERIGAYNGNPDSNVAYTNSEVARNPLDSQRYLIGVRDNNFANSDDTRLTSDLDIGTKYGISQFVVSGGNTGSTANSILFDHLGRPYRGNTNTAVATVINSPVHRLATGPLFIKICTSLCSGNDNTATNDDELVIRIEQETGFSCVLVRNSNNQCI
jgi:prepilin-type N-terminal cleavage/methylation domain-containing protein